jgi:hypothetical protein
MAEQNRKTSSEKYLRQKAREVVENYIDYVIFLDFQDDIANEGKHILGTYAEHGSLPKGSGFSGFCTLGSRVDQIRRQHLTSAMIDASQVIKRLTPELRGAICMDVGLRGKVRAVATDPFNEKTVAITCSVAWCAGQIGISEAAYRKRVSNAYKQIEVELQPEKLAA